MYDESRVYLGDYLNLFYSFFLTYTIGIKSVYIQEY